MRVLLVDHRDSFTGNLLHDLGTRIGRRPVLCESTGEAPPPDPDGFDLVVLGPGPGHPGVAADAGHSLALVRRCRERGTPLFGVCFGMQLMVVACGGAVRPAAAILHGEHPPLRHSGAELFAGLPERLPMMRYHSLVVAPDALPAEFEPVAWSDRQEVMAIRHRALPWWGVQFHPESVGSPQGGVVLDNLLRLVRERHRRQEENP